MIGRSKMAKVVYECRINSMHGDMIFQSDNIEDIRKKAYISLKRTERKKLYIVVWRGRQPGYPYAIVEKKEDGIIYENLEKRTVQYFKKNGTLYPYR